MKLLKQFFSDLMNFQIVNVAKSLICSSLNLVIYLIIAVVILGLKQGNVIPLDLYIYTNTLDLILNISIFHFLIYFLGLIMSLYPTYIYAFLFDDKDDKYYTSTSFGLIYYDYKDASEKKKGAKPVLDLYSLKFIEGAVRKFLGVLLFNIWSLMIVYVYCTHQINSSKEYIVIVIYLVFTALILFTFWYLTIKVKRELNSGNNVTYYENFAKAYYKYYLPILFVVIGILCFLVAYLGWHFYTVIAQLVVCLILAMHLLIYRTFRKYFKPINKIVNYLALHRRLGFVVLVFILAINISTNLSESINPINIIIANLIAMYTGIIIGFKIYLFLKYRNKENTENYIPIWKLKFKLKHLAITFFGLFFFLILKVAIPDKSYKLHRLGLVDTQEEKKISLPQFYNKFIKVHSPEKSPILYAAYGGGLKAHYWNFMILDHLYKNDSFDNILAMSGVSGGGMGIGTFTASQFFEYTATERQNLINQVKHSNILSVELSWLFGYDLLRSSLPEFCYKGRNNRSYRAMRFYGDILGSSQLVNETSFYEVHQKLFNKSYYPNLIINSTATTNKYGVVSAIVNDNMFPGAINLLDIGGKGSRKTLTYFEALSTCNRFPIISPPANVPNKGQFLDGGYFENSGIMSLISFKKALEKHEKRLNKDSIFYKKIKLVSVRNGKFNYLQSILSRGNLDIDKIQDSEIIKFDEKGNLTTIVNGIANLERMPTYIKSTLSEYHNHEYDFIDIDLPYYIDTSEIENLLNGKISTAKLAAIIDLVNNSNEIIEGILDNVGIVEGTKSIKYELENWGIVNPPTARILSRPVEIYMEAMMQHPYVIEQLERAIE